MADETTPIPARSLLPDGVLRALTALHARGFHAAIVAGVLTMPLVAFVGFWTERPPAATPALSLRGTLDAGRVPAAATDGRS